GTLATWPTRARPRISRRRRSSSSCSAAAGHCSARLKGSPSWLVGPPSRLLEREAFSRAIPDAPLEDAMQRRGEFRVSVTKDDLVFASAHFITFEGHACEGLHGHNYRAHVT